MKTIRRGNANPKGVWAYSGAQKKRHFWTAGAVTASCGARATGFLYGERNLLPLNACKRCVGMAEERAQ